MFTGRRSEGALGRDRRKRLGSQVQTGRKIKPERVALINTAAQGASSSRFQGPNDNGKGFFFSGGKGHLVRELHDPQPC